MQVAARVRRRMQQKDCQFFISNPDLDPDYVPDLIDRDPKWLDLACHPYILDVVEQMLGPHMIVWGSALFCKRADVGKATPWDQDGQYDLWPQ